MRKYTLLGEHYGLTFEKNAFFEMEVIPYQSASYSKDYLPADLLKNPSGLRSTELGEALLLTLARDTLESLSTDSPRRRIFILRGVNEKRCFLSLESNDDLACAMRCLRDNGLVFAFPSPQNRSVSGALYQLGPTLEDILQTDERFREIHNPFCS